MSQLSREDCIELGISVPNVPLVVWATEQLSVAKGRQERLEGRGVTPAFLQEIKTLIRMVVELENTLGKEKTSLSSEVAPFQKLREQASAYCQEAKQIVKIEFGTCPEIQVRGRLGVRTGRLLSNLCREIECVVAVLREQLPQLSWLGVDEAFINAGDELVGKLKEAQAKLVRAIQALSPNLAEQCCLKGQLYDLCRKLVRIGQLEYLHEPEQAAAFNYTLLRKDLRAGSEVRAKSPKSVAR
jgi:hypothetical protein